MSTGVTAQQCRQIRHRKPRKTKPAGFSSTHTGYVALKTSSVRGSLTETLFNYRTLLCTPSATCNTEGQKQNSHWWVRNPCRQSAAVFITVNKPATPTFHRDRQQRASKGRSWLHRDPENCKFNKWGNNSDLASSSLCTLLCFPFKKKLHWNFLFLSYF